MGYELDGFDLIDTYGIHVMEVNGIHDFLKRKGETAHNWLDDDGEEEYTDSSDIYFEPRDITLICYIKNASRSTLLTNLAAFKHKLEKPGLHTFEVPYDATVFNIYHRDGGKFKMETKWTANEYIGKFTIRLREPEPARS